MPHFERIHGKNSNSAQPYFLLPATFCHTTFLTPDDAVNKKNETVTYLRSAS